MTGSAGIPKTLSNAITIGGNTSQELPQRGLRGNTVGKHKIKIDDCGFVSSQGKCAFYAVLKPPRSVEDTELDFPGQRRWPWLLREARA